MTSTVNVPTNTKLKEQDINNKLQLYGIYAGTSNFIPTLELAGSNLNSFCQWQGAIQ